MSASGNHREINTVGKPPGPRSGSAHLDSIASVVKFAAMAGALAMVGDAVVAHAILWQNDPYWTYWVTDTFLITTIFATGTALFGVGIGRGAALTAVQTLVLTTYYWTLSPIGLPANPQWLDLRHTWVTGLPVHFAIYYLGYLSALWIWRRHQRTVSTGGVAGDAGRALAVGSGIVVALGLLQTALLGDFPGVTWFIVRLVVMVPFVLAWWAMAGRDRGAAVGGGLVAGVLLAAYTHYLGPVGLPDSDLRVVAENPPPTPAVWLSYREEFLVMLPVTVTVTVLAFLVASVWHGHRWTTPRPSGRALLAAAAAIIAIVATGVTAAGSTSTADECATVTATGAAVLEDGPFYTGEWVDTPADLRMTAESRNTKQTPLPPHDLVSLTADITSVDGIRFEVTAESAMVSDPLGRWGTAGGVGYDRWQFGRSGIGTTQLPAVNSDVVVTALGDVRADGELIATGVPVRVMTRDDGGMELHVGEPASPLPALPNRHLRVVWEQVDAHAPESPELMRNLFGGVLLLVLLGLAWAAVRNQKESSAAPVRQRAVRNPTQQ